MGLISRVSSRTYRNMYKPPSWASIPAHDKDIKDVYLEVSKNNEPVDRVDLCDKSHYLIGRNSDLCDIIVEHQSLSRIHAVILFHPGMKSFFLHDNNSVHGTFIGKSRLQREPKPLPFNAKFSFGASTRSYILKRGGGHVSEGQVEEDKLDEEIKKAAFMGSWSLPEDQHELDALTDSNTRKNLRFSTHDKSLTNKSSSTTYNP